MKIFFLLILLLALLAWLMGPQEQTDVAPDIEIREFFSSVRRGYLDNTYNRNSNKTDTRTRERIYRDEIRNRNSIENRSRDMRELEESIAKERVYAKPVDLYRYIVVLKNTGPKTIRSVFWDFQATDTATFDSPSHRQFWCEVKLKPTNTERLEGYSSLPPVTVVSATGTGKTTKRLVINRIEYADGTSWQRSDWYLPDKSTKYYGPGKCQPL